VAPTLAPANTAPTSPTGTTIRNTPDFTPIGPVEKPVDRPDRPAVTEFQFIQEAAFRTYRVDLTGIRARGVIADVSVQVINGTCGTDVTGVLNADAVAQFKSALIGRGNTFDEVTEEGFNLTNFIFPTDISFFDDGRILSKGTRDVVIGFQDGAPVVEEDQLTGDDVSMRIIITDSFGQQVIVTDSIFNEGETRLNLPCGFLF
jgi:hypothetical protein